MATEAVGRRDKRTERGYLPNQAIAEGFRHGFRFGVHLQLVIDAAHVKGNGVDTHS